MDSVLQKLNSALQEGVDTLDGPLHPDLLSTLKDPDSLPHKKTWELASRTVDLTDRLVRQLQPAALQLADSYLAYLETKCLWTAVSSNIPDTLATAGPQSVAELARRSGLQPLRLGQVMRVLHNNGIFVLDAGTGLYSNSASSAMLTKAHWTQWHRWVELAEARSAAQIEYGTHDHIFAYFAARGLQNKFHATLGAGAVAQAPGMLADYPWAELGDAVVLDVGGGGGDLIVSLLRAHGNLRGALLELEPVVGMVQPRFRDADGVFADVGDRMVALHVGDFRDAVPAYEVYTMKWCLHNWRDDDVVGILSAVRRAIVETPRARMVVIEAVLAEGRSSRVWHYGDLTMMSTVNGQERTEGEWRALAGRAGWESDSISPLRNAWAAAIDLGPIRVELDEPAQN
ncbi:S-adenosyl-L-methionine-dependent methyltransferase [Parathielavia hyrcaniae]|uniref:S-adenosyl-L-methionine-dependent methyltransferase n=1 Tax=Parathielavia hyrcaniae TaxID=113614 RepID=A0AAN6PX03_9PEZI|nr:S-adenosyl-L-methionine-dependent methyltransferase [Parathielavia hyrcaniae]